MSMHGRHEWRDQQALVNERLKGFLDNPGNEQLEAVLAQLQEYADAARRGQLEIPQCWICTD